MLPIDSIMLESECESESENVTYRFHNVCQSFGLHKPNMSTYHQDTNSEKNYSNLSNTE